MSSFSNDGEKGASNTIIPTARKPIRADRSDTMVYRKQILHSSKEQICPTSVNKGTDEVDNVMSKLRAESPLTLRRNIPNGSDVDEGSCESDTESLNEEALSSSPNRSSSSYGNYSRNSFKSSHNSSKLQYKVSETRRDSIYSHNDDHVTISDSHQITTTRYMFVIISITLIAIAVYLCYVWNKEVINTSNSYDRFSFYNDVRNVGLQYKLNDDSMLQIKAGIDTIYKRQDTGSFIFAYDSSKDNFESVKFDKFMDNIALFAARYLRNDSVDVHHVVVENAKIMHLKSDYDLIEKFQANVEEKGVLLVKNIENVPTRYAMAFHYYCDEFNPLVKKSAIFFTFDVAKCSISSSYKASHDFIEKCLKSKWKDLEGDKIVPLLNRVVNIVIDVISI